MEQKKGVLIKCHGGYYFNKDSSKGIKPFEYDVKAPSLEFFRETTRRYVGVDENNQKQYKESSFINIRGVLKKRLLPLLLGRKYVDFARVRFVVIDEVTSLDGANLDLPINLRSKKQLAQYVREKNMPMNPDEYIEIDDLRTDILEYETDADAFIRDMPQRMKRRTEEKEFIQMNELEMGLPPSKPKVITAIFGCPFPLISPI